MARVDRSAAPASAPALGTALLGALIVASSVAYGFARLATARPIAAATLEDLCAGRATTPFQYRVLVPFVLSRLFTLVPALAASAGAVVAVNEALFHLATTGVAVAWFRARGASAQGAAARALIVAAVPFLYFVLPPFRPFYFPSDTPGCFFLLASLVAASVGRWHLFALVVVVGTVNRETPLLAVAAAAVALHAHPERRGPDATRGLCSAAVGFVVVKALLAWVYADNPGAGLFEVFHRVGGGRAAGAASHLATNLHALASPKRAAFVGVLAVAPLVAGAAAARRIDDPVLAAYARVAALYLGLMLVIGNLDELRIFGEVVLPLALVLVPYASRRGSQATAAPSSRPSSAPIASASREKP